MFAFGLVAERSLLRTHFNSTQNLASGAEARAQGAVDGAPMAGGVGVLAGEEEGVVDRLCHLGGAVECADGRVAVCAEGPGIVLPIVQVPVT